MGFSTEWDEMYKAGMQNSIWPWSEVVSHVNRYFRGDKHGLRVLELGCGAGANIPFFVSVGAEYYGIEGSITEVEMLQKRFCQDGVTVKQGDFTLSLPFEGEFDLVLDRAALMHNATEDIEKAIALAYGKLKKGGYFFGFDWPSENYEVFTDENEIYDVIDANTKVFHSGYYNGLGRVHYSDSEHIRKLFERMEIVEMYEKLEKHMLPQEKRTARWSFVARK